MPSPKFLLRLARIPEVLNVLSAYEGGLPLAALAEQFDTDVDTMRQDLTTYLDLESWGWFENLFHRPAIEFVASGDTAADEESGDTIVRVVPDASPGLGADYLDAGELSVIYTAGLALLEVEPDNEHLSSALHIIADTMYGEPTSGPRVGTWTQRLRTIEEARELKRKVRIEYSRAWTEGVSIRVIEPLRLVQTKRGWEVDAGPVGEEGNLRTFLLTNIRSVELLADTFEPPRDVDGLLAKQRTTQSVQMTIAQDARWAARQFAERDSVVAEDDEMVTLDLELLPPLDERVALIMLASGPSTTVNTGALMPKAVKCIAELLAHHEQE